MTNTPENPILVLVIEDNFLIAQDIVEALTSSGFQSIGPVSTYAEALEYIDHYSAEFCILDLDLGRGMHSGFGPGEEGRRLLSVLCYKDIPTVVYSAYTRMQHQLEGIHPNIVSVDKLEPTESVVDAIHSLRNSRPQK
jgi:CheY-like chemotaxis protein